MILLTEKGFVMHIYTAKGEFIYVRNSFPHPMEKMWKTRGYINIITDCKEENSVSDVENSVESVDNY